MQQSKERNTQPSRKELIYFKTLVLFGVIAAVFFLQWFLDSDFRSRNILYSIIVAAFLYKIIGLVLEWILSFHPKVKEKPEFNTKWKVDVLTTYVKGEPKDMLFKTLEAIQKITYPHESFLCDEADDPELKEYCLKNNIHHVTRKEKIDAKAGNINNALNTVAKGDICLILDPDHIVYPNFLDEVLPYFEDDNVGYVQVVQAYYNQYETVVAKAAAEQTYQFYGPMMMTLNGYGSAPAIGANCTFRREALDSIGGHAPGLTEDMHTTLKLHAKGWKSVYNPVIVAKGLIPWNYSGYCHQQLKWSRGSFDLLFNVFPKLFKKLSFFQIITFLSVPFFYLSGFFALIDFAVPIIALLTGIIPIKVGVVEFIIHFTPLLVMQYAIRQFGQRWYYEKHEKGIALLGGTLFKASWWATLIGFLYSLVNKKVPYIPTEKEFKYETPWKLLVPNFLIISVSLFAVVYGLIRDFNPFYLFMAGLALTNVATLSLGNLMASQHIIIYVHSKLKGTFISKGSKTRKAFFRIRHSIYGKFQKVSISFGLIVLVAGIFAFNTYKHKKNEEALKRNYVEQMKDVGTKYWGLESASLSNLSGLNYAFVKKEVDLGSFNEKLVFSFIDSCYFNNIIPFISFSIDSNICAGIDTGLYYSDIQNIFLYLRKSYLPVFIMLEKKDFSTNWKDLYFQTYFKIFKQSDSLSLSTNIAWIWHTNDLSAEEYIDRAKHFLSWIYLDNKSAIGQYNRNYYLKWKNKYPIQIMVNNKQVLEFNRKSDVKDWHETNINAFVDLYKSEDNHSLDFNLNSFNVRSEDKVNERRKFDFYIKGVAYNPAHDWRDNSVNIPLTKEKLHGDFKLIKDMGANTIRRYAPTFYDYNILNACNEFDLNIIYGFWFDPKVDYLTDSRRIKGYKKEVLKLVQRYKDDSAVVAWSLGNETWSLLKLHYGQPYLSVVRKAYLNMISELAIEIKKIDPDRPIIAAEEHYNLPSSMYSYKHFVPEIDVFAVNSYYLRNISKLDSFAQVYLGDEIPYLVSEFGNKGYWLKNESDFIFDSIIWETSSQQKAEFYEMQWEEFIEKNKDHNVGGIAFCWQDRYEKTSTWFGITDIFGNKKPVYYTLKECFTEKKTFSSRLPEYKILLYNEVFKEGFVTARAISTNVFNRDELFFKWMIYEDKSFVKVMETDFEKGAYNFTFKSLPNPENYRLYLYVRDDKDNVVTESRTLIVY
jgi:cellulose synthase (UDP-forming)